MRLDDSEIAADVQAHQRWLRQPFPTVQLYLAFDAGEFGAAARRWFRDGWPAWGYELYDWFASAQHRQGLSGRLPEGATMDLYQANPEVHCRYVDRDLPPEDWEPFLAACGHSDAGSVDAGRQVRSSDGHLWRGSAGEVVEGIELYHRRVSDRYLIVRAVARAEFLLSNDRQEHTMGLLKEIADAGDPAYGEVAHAATGLDYTAYEYALGLSGVGTLEAVLGSARTVLRGYGWVTIIASQLASRLDSTALGSFAQVSELDGGGLWLQATELFTDYDEAASARVASALRPILRPGRPVASPARQSLIVTAEPTS